MGFLELRCLNGVSEEVRRGAQGEIAVEAVGFSSGSMAAEMIRVRLSGAARAADLRGIRQYVEETFGACEVMIGYV